MTICMICNKNVDIQDLQYHVDEHSYRQVREMLLALMSNFNLLDWKQTKLVYKK